MNWQYLEDMSKVTPYEGTPLKLKKTLYAKINTAKGPVLEPVKGPLSVGDELVVRIELRVDRDMEYVHLKDQRGSGTEPVNVLSRYKYQDGLAYYESTRDVASHFFIDYLPKGTYVFEYSTRVQLRGQYQTGVAQIQCMYAPGVQQPQPEPAADGEVSADRVCPPSGPAVVSGESRRSTSDRRSEVLRRDYGGTAALSAGGSVRKRARKGLICVRQGIMLCIVVNATILQAPNVGLTCGRWAGCCAGSRELLRAWSESWNVNRLVLCAGTILAGSGLYGAAMGWWRAPLAGAFVAIKFPLIMLLTATGNALLNAMLAPLLGLNISLRQSFLANLISFTIASAILGAFAPLAAFMVWNAPPMTADVARSAGTYSFIQVTHVAVIAFAGVAANLRLVSAPSRTERQRGDRAPGPVCLAGRKPVAGQPAHVDSASVHRLAQPAGGVPARDSLPGQLLRNGIQILVAPGKC